MNFITSKGFEMHKQVKFSNKNEQYFEVIMTPFSTER